MELAAGAISGQRRSASGRSGTDGLVLLQLASGTERAVAIQPLASAAPSQCQRSSCSDPEQAEWAIG